MDFSAAEWVEVDQKEVKPERAKMFSPKGVASSLLLSRTLTTEQIRECVITRFLSNETRERPYILDLVGLLREEYLLADCAYLAEVGRKMCSEFKLEYRDVWPGNTVIKYQVRLVVIT